MKRFVRKKLILVFIVAVLMLSYSVTVFADINPEAIYPPDVSDYATYGHIQLWNKAHDGDGYYDCINISVASTYERIAAVLMDDNFYIISKNDLYNKYNSYFGKSAMVNSGSYTVSTSYMSGLGYDGYPAISSSSHGAYVSDAVMWAVSDADIWVFDNVADAIDYLETGDSSGGSWGPRKSYDSSQIYLDNFEMIIHDSNNYDKYYVEFLYKPSQYLIDNNGYIEVYYNWDFEYTFLSGFVSFDIGDYYDAEGCACIIDLDAYPSSYKLYLKDFASGGSITTPFKKMLLGKELFIDFSGLSIEGVGAETIANITVDKISFDLIPMVGVTQGKKYAALLDILNPGSSYTYSSTSDSDGNYTTNNDASGVNGYYYTEEKTDESGNTSYTYYYYSKDGDRHEISAEDNNNNSYSGTSSSSSIVINNNPTFNNNINVNIPSASGDVTIEDDDYSDSELRRDLKDGFGIFDDVTTEAKNDGFLAMLTNFFSSIDPDLNDILAFGITTVVVVNIILTVLKR